jgi:hypothetical protein
MPQPLNRARPQGTNVRWNSDEVFDAHPELAMLVLKCIAKWTRLDFNVNLFVISLLGANAEIGMPMLDSLTSAPARRDAIKAAVDIALPSDHTDRPFFDAAMKITNSLQGRRNRLVHHLWGTCEDLPGTLILSEPASISSLFLGFGQLRRVDQEFQFRMFGKSYVYTEADLRELLQELEEACEAWHVMSALVRQSLPLEPQGRDAARATLRAIPSVARMLAAA